MALPSTLQSPFRGGGNVMEPNHTIRYIYPSLITYSASQLVLPLRLVLRPRPRSPEHLQAWNHRNRSEQHKDHVSVDPVGRALNRITAWAGNTTVECGQFWLSDPRRLAFVIRRRTVWSIDSSHEKFVAEEDTYEILAEEWEDYIHLPTRTCDGDTNDAWWVRLDDLIKQPYDRAYRNVQARLDELGIQGPMQQWFPREDLECDGVSILYNKADADRLVGKAKECKKCMKEYFQYTDVPVLLPCNHHICLGCMITIRDPPVGRRPPREEFWQCPVPDCRRNIDSKYSHLDFLHLDEIRYWRWRTIYDYMQTKMSGEGFVSYLKSSTHAAGDIYNSPLTINGKITARTMPYEDVVDFIDKFVVPVDALLPWGHARDNPVTFIEAQHILQHLKDILKDMDRAGEMLDPEELAQDLVRVVATAFRGRADVVLDEQYNLGNPQVPPGLGEHVNFLCEWIAKGCFLHPDVVRDHKAFVARLVREEGVWWKYDAFLKDA